MLLDVDKEAINSFAVSLQRLRAGQIVEGLRAIAPAETVISVVDQESRVSVTVTGPGVLAEWNGGPWIIRGLERGGG